MLTCFCRRPLFNASTVGCLNTLLLSYRSKAGVFFQSHSSFLDSISLIFTAHWGNPDRPVKPTGHSVTLGRRLCLNVCVFVCRMMSGGKDWLLPLSVHTFRCIEKGRKRGRKWKIQQKPHGLSFIFYCTIKKNKKKKKNAPANFSRLHALLHN